MNSRKSLRGTFTLGTLGAALLATSSCSVLYDFSTKQCDSTEECTAKGTQFHNSVCQNHVCVMLATTNAGGAPSTGGQSSTELPTGGDTSTLGGAPTGGTTSTEPPGTGGAPACTNAKCIADNNGVPSICHNGACVQLTSPECPILIPQKTASDLIKKDGVIVVGGFATMGNTADLHDTLAVYNWDMAFDEFNTGTLGGLPNVSNSGQRPFVGLICNSNAATTDSINAAMQHLSGDLQVPALLSTLSTTYLYQVWQYLNPDADAGLQPDPMFIMSTGSADLRLANLADDGLMWHMLGDPRVLAATTVALLKQIEPYVNAQRLAAGDDPAITPLRVTLVYSDDQIMLDATSILTQPTEDPNYPGTVLKFNNKLALANGDAFRQVRIDSATLHATPVVNNATTDIQANPPHVIVAMSTYEFPKTVIPGIENTWPADPTKIRPYYLLSHRIFNRPELQTVANQFSTKSPSLSMRTVGVNFAGSQEDRAKNLYAFYLSKLKSTAQSTTLSLDSSENYYDGAYYLLYSIAAAGATRARPTADDIYTGLTSRIISTSSSAASINVGLDPIAGTTTGTGTITQLFSNPSGYKMSLYGCSGPPNFDRLTGARITESSAWCITASAGVATFKPDGLIFDAAAKTFSSPAAGIPTCLRNYCNVDADAGVAACPQN